MSKQKVAMSGSASKAAYQILLLLGESLSN